MNKKTNAHKRFDADVRVIFCKTFLRIEPYFNEGIPFIICPDCSGSGNIWMESGQPDDPFPAPCKKCSNIGEISLLDLQNHFDAISFDELEGQIAKFKYIIEI